MNDVARVNAFLDLLTSLPVSRRSWKIRHLPHVIIFICIAGSLYGFDDFARIEDAAKSGDYVLARIGNQPTVFEKGKEYFSEEVLEEIRMNKENTLRSPKCGYRELLDKGHVRCERREYEITNDFITSIDPNEDMATKFVCNLLSKDPIWKGKTMPRIVFA